MNRDSFSASDIANDLFAVQRIAATRPRHHQIVDAAHNDRIVAQPNKTFDRANATAQTRLFLFVELLKLFLTKILCNYIAWNQFAVADAREEVFDASVTIFISHSLHFTIAVAKNFLCGKLKPRRLFLE